MMDLVAIQDLQAGDELVLAMDMDSTMGHWVLSPDLLPTHWMKMTSHQVNVSQRPNKA